MYQTYWYGHIGVILVQKKMIHLILFNLFISGYMHTFYHFIGVQIKCAMFGTSNIEVQHFKKGEKGENISSLLAVPSIDFAVWEIHMIIDMISDQYDDLMK